MESATEKSEEPICSHGRSLGILICMIITTILTMPHLAWADAGDQNNIAPMVQRAGNAGTDEERLALLKELQMMAPGGSALRQEAAQLIREIERWISDPRLDYFGSQVLKQGAYDFGIPETSPLHPIAELYQARMNVWVTLEYGGYWNDPKARRERFDAIRPLFEKACRSFPDNRLMAMYLGRPLPAPQTYEAPEDAPQWAALQREGLERLADIVLWWIRHRQQETGEYGGGWGDDCEMWRWWVPVLIAFEDPEIVQAQARFSKALLNQEHMKGGYTDHVYDVEHTSEDSSDALTPMMHLEPENEAWSDRALCLAELMRTLWSGTNERGFLQFKSTYFSVTEVDPDPRKACDTVYHPRAVQPTLLLWQRTANPDLSALFTAWMDTWVDAAARAERGKPAGIIPSAIHWPDGGIGGLGKTWWDPENHTKDPLYVWPSSMPSMLHTLLLTYHMTNDPRYLQPLKSMARARLDYLDNPPEAPPQKGSWAWCGSKLGGLSQVAAKYKLLTGQSDFDELLAADIDPYVSYRLRGEIEPMVDALQRNAEALRINLEGFTSEVRYTDRVLRFPSILGENGMFPKAPGAFHTPNPSLLYATATGDPGGAGYFPIAAVRWLTPPRDIAALVTDSGSDHFEAELFHFGEAPRSMETELYLLNPGDYRFSLTPKPETPKEDDWQDLSVASSRTRISLTLPARVTCLLRVESKHWQDGPTGQE